MLTFPIESFVSRYVVLTFLNGDGCGDDDTIGDRIDLLSEAQLLEVSILLKLENETTYQQTIVFHACSKEKRESLERESRSLWRYICPLSR